MTDRYLFDFAYGNKLSDAGFSVTESDFINEFIMVKDKEWVDYSRHVSDWEIDRYLEYY